MEEYTQHESKHFTSATSFSRFLSLCFSASNTWATATLTSCAYHVVWGSSQGEGLELPGGLTVFGGGRSDGSLDSAELYNMHQCGKIDQNPPGEGDCKWEQREVWHVCRHQELNLITCYRSLWSRTAVMGLTRSEAQKESYTSHRVRTLVRERNEENRGSVKSDKDKTASVEMLVDSDYCSPQVWSRAGRVMKSSSGTTARAFRGVYYVKVWNKWIPPVKEHNESV